MASTTLLKMNIRGVLKQIEDQMDEVVNLAVFEGADNMYRIKSPSGDYPLIPLLAAKAQLLAALAVLEANK